MICGAPATKSGARCNITKCCARQEKWRYNLRRKPHEPSCTINAGLFENDSHMIRPLNCKTQPVRSPPQQRTPSRQHIYILRFRAPAPNAAPAHKSETPTSPNAALATKSDAPTSPNFAPATKSDMTRQHHLKAEAAQKNGTATSPCRCCACHEVKVPPQHALATKSETPTSPTIAPAKKGHTTATISWHKSHEASLADDSSMIRPWSDDDASMNWPSLACPLLCPLLFVLWRRILENATGYLPKFDHGAAPATKSDTPTSPNTYVPPTKSDAPTSPKE